MLALGASAGAVCAPEKIRQEDYLEIYDVERSDEEDRFIAIGPIRRGVVLVVWTERLSADDEEIAVRIISARWATKRERRHFRSLME